jgi:hypothetical protein
LCARHFPNLQIPVSASTIAGIFTALAMYPAQLATSLASTDRYRERQLSHSPFPRHSRTPPQIDALHLARHRCVWLHRAT